MNRLKESILITGGTGYIGSHTLKLLDAGYKIILDNLSNSSIKVKTRLKI